jgi:hypothetical protein
VTITAYDNYGNVATGYRGTVRLTSSDVQAGLPANYTFQATDAGVHTFSVTLKTAGTQSITAADMGASSITGSQTGIQVTAGAATHFSISVPSSVTGGTAFTITVTALDAYGNVATGYGGHIHFTSSDRHAILPADYAFISSDNGVHQFTITLKTRGTQSITVKDTAKKTSISGTGSVSVK